MNSIKNIIFVCLVSLPMISLGAEFPTGKFKGTGFIVEKGTIKLTDADMSKFESQLIITKKGKSKVAFKVSVKMQRYPNTPTKNDNRYDVFSVRWDSDNTGSLINENKQYSGDKSTFIIDGKKLTVKSWISRNQLFETHVYEKQ